jgi:hypothetical protein
VKPRPPKESRPPKNTSTALETLPDHDEESALKSALALARWGCPVFPLRPGTKVPATARGFKDASRNPAVIREWWQRNPDYGVGVATGHGLAVLDVDVNGGVDGGVTLAELERKHDKLPLTPMAITGSDGGHWYFLAPGDTLSSLGFAPGLDLKAAGGYVVAPPSVHPNGERYRWDVGDYPTEKPLATIPEWLLENGEPHNRAPASVLPKKLASGQGRNNALASLAGSMRRRGAEESAIQAALRAENAAYADPLEDAEVAKIARSVARYAPAEARSPEPQAAEGFNPQPLDWQRLQEEGLPQIEYLLEPYLPRGARIWAWGRTESGKTIWAQWVTAELTRREIKVVFFSQENPLQEDVRRLARLEPNWSYLRYFHGQGLDLADRDHVRFVVGESKGAGLVVFDAISSCWSGDEESNAEIAALDREALVPIVEGGASVLVIDHVGHRQMFNERKGATAGRGASAKGQKADVVLEFKVEGDNGFEIVHGKNRLGGHKVPAAAFLVEDGEEGELQIVGTERAADARILEVAGLAVVAVESAGQLTTNKLREALSQHRMGQQTTKEVLKLLENESPPRLRVSWEKVQTERGRQRAKVWRLAGEPTLA